MENQYVEDFKKGDIFDIGEHTFSEEEIIDFAKKYDPFPFHINKDAAEKTVFGGIISSGWLTALVWLGMMHKSFLSYDTTMGSPGHEEMIWPKPVRPGDSVSGQLEILESRGSKSKPELGFVRYEAKLVNQENEIVFITKSTLMIKTRN
jgi:acyl dehydratase